MSCLSPTLQEAAAMKTSKPALFSQPRRLLAFAAVAALAAPLLALPVTSVAHDRDHEDARRALLSGEVLSLRQVLDIVAREYPGEPVEVEFERDDGIYLYELKVLQPSGRIIKMKVDAGSGKIISVKARNGKKEDD